VGGERSEPPRSSRGTNCVNAATGGEGDGRGKGRDLWASPHNVLTALSTRHSGCMGLLPQKDGGGGCAVGRHRPGDGRPEARGFGQPYRSAGMSDDHAGDPQIAGDVLHMGGKGAVLERVAIAARRAAALAAMHPAAGLAVDRRRAARPAGAGARAAAGGVGEDLRLHVRLVRHGFVPGRAAASAPAVVAGAGGMAEIDGESKNKKRTLFSGEECAVARREA